jgi:glycosyltransferase involved in cell wall biosynthesis
MRSTAVCLAHDYLTQRGGAERVALIMADAFEGAPLHTTLYDPAATFPEFARVDVRASALNRVGALRSRYRMAMPLLAPTVSGMKVDADVLITSSSGWAHGIGVTGRKVVYCHAPARWLYQTDRYLGRHASTDLRSRLHRAPAAMMLGALSSGLRSWDMRAAQSAHRYLANSTVTRNAILDAYGIEAEVLPPPPALLPDGPELAVDGVEPGYFLCVARLLPYKNVDVVIDAVRRVPGARLVVVGDGPELPRLRRIAEHTPSVQLLGRVPDEQLRWLYRNSTALVAASYEDYGLSPLEAATFGRPSVVMRAGGYLDTVVPGQTGVFFARPEADQIAEAMQFADVVPWDEQVLTAHAARFGAERFQARLREIADEERASLYVRPAATPLQRPLSLAA